MISLAPHPIKQVVPETMLKSSQTFLKPQERRECIKWMSTQRDGLILVTNGSGRGRGGCFYYFQSLGCKDYLEDVNK